MTAFPALALAIAMTYLIGDLYHPHLPKGLAYLIDFAVCVVIFRFTHLYLKKLKE